MENHFDYKKTETTLSGDTVQHENYISNSEWQWLSYNYEITPVTSIVRKNNKFSQGKFSKKAFTGGTFSGTFLHPPKY